MVVGFIVIVSILASDFLISAINPILLTPDMANAFTIVMAELWRFEGIIPFEAIWKCLAWDMSVLIGFIAFRLIMSVISQITGTGKVNID